MNVGVRRGKRWRGTVTAIASLLSILLGQALLQGLLLEAVATGDARRAERLLRWGANPNGSAYRPRGIFEDYDLHVLVVATPFVTLAAKRQDAEMVALLLRAGARVDARDTEGRTALSYAADGPGNGKVAGVLRAAGAGH